VELPELLLEVQAWTGFASDFTHVNEHGARADDLPISVCAVLLAEARNVGLEPLVRPDYSALTRARLDWIQQNYLRADTITGANVRLVDFHAALPLWNTRYMGLALDELRRIGVQVNPDDVERLSPLVHHHIHFDGRYSFTLPEPLAHGELRSLRDPNDPAEQVFDLMAASA
jgi:Tn3 transposase DDE domain